MLLILTNLRGYAQVDEITWSIPINISNTPDATSTDPFLLADPAGGVHLFWAEKMDSTVPSNQADSIMYAYWDGTSWTNPVNLFFSPLSDGNPTAVFPRAVLDETGRIHLIWMSDPNDPKFSLNYSSANAWEAGNASAWEPPRVLADELVGAQYSEDIAYSPEQGLHISYATINQTVTYINSMDKGKTWSDPIDIHTIQAADRGAANLLFLLAPPSQINLSWTEWDDSGNGQALYFVRSLNNGKDWENPIILSERRGEEYERDYNSMTLLGQNQIVTIWEGGWRAYRQVQYSDDGGATWSDPIDVFPYLIGDNGSVEYIRDSANNLHVFVANRIREGNTNRSGFGLWHSVLEGGRRWRDPTLAIGDERFVKNMTNPKLAIVNGNKVVAVWYGSQVNEIMVATGLIGNAPPIPSKPWVHPAQELTNTPVPGEIQPTSTPQAALPVLQIDPQDPGYVGFYNPAIDVLIGVAPVLLILTLLIVFVRQRRSAH